MKKVSFVSTMCLSLVLAGGAILASSMGWLKSSDVSYESFNSVYSADRQGVDITGENCFAIIAGKATTVDGSVLFGHNEDDSGEQMLNVYIAPEGNQPAVTDGGLKIPASVVNARSKK
ncbi:MAG: hypothetical protein II511_05580, partial [Bacteroidales bacterium]|nr:hypothetical protein [Bacteroidales bacterium]